ENATVTEQDLTVAVTVRSSATIAALKSPTPGMATRVDSPHEAHASFEQSQAALAPFAQDLVVVARTAASEPALAVHVFRPARGDAFFAAVVTPPELDEDRVLARDVTLALDVSGSMNGEKLEQAKRAALWLFEHLR